jgi:hypothetical protein
MLYTDDVILVDEIRTVVDQKLELWGQTLEAKCFRLSKSKIKYMKYSFNATTKKEGMLELIVTSIQERYISLDIDAQERYSPRSPWPVVACIKVCFVDPSQFEAGLGSPQDLKKYLLY